MSRNNQRVLTPQQVRRRDKALAPVDAAIQYINGVLDDPVRRKAATADASVGGFFHISMNVRLTPQEAYELQERCRAANWTSGQVVVWQDRTSVCLHTRKSAIWDSAYDGKPLAKVLAITL